MDFNVFFKDNLYILFGILIYMLFNNSNHEKYNSRVIVIYSLILFFSLSNSLNIIVMLSIFLFLFFFQFEIFIEDNFKHKLINRFWDKIIDCLYLLVFRYCFPLYLLVLFLASKVDFIMLDLDSLYYLTYSIVIYSYVVFFISSRDFELNSFDDIMKKLSPNAFSYFTPLSDNKKNILVEIEDRTFFYRRTSYNSLSFWIMMFKIRTVINLFINHRERKINNPEIKQTFKERLSSIYYFVRRQIRGYSTLEMQLYRQVAVKDGYMRKYQRKIAEFVYSQLLFKNLKKYFKLNYDIVSFERYKLFLIHNYLKYAPVFVGNKKYNNYYDLFGKRRVSDCDFLLYVLSLSGKLNRPYLLSIDGKIDIDLFECFYKDYLRNFNISDKQLKSTIKFFNSKR